MEEEDDKLEQIKSWYSESKNNTSSWRESAKLEFDYVAGKQWSETDKAKLNEQLRPAVTFNRIGPVIDNVCGLEINNRQEVTYLPRDIDDTGVNDVLTSAAAWARDECNAEDEESDAFRDMAICGMGWLETRLSYEEDPRGMMYIDRIDPLEMFWDSSAKKSNLSDAQHVMRVVRMSKSDAKAMFPDADESILDASWVDKVNIGEEDIETDGDYPDIGSPEESNIEDEKNKVSIVHCQWYDKEAYVVMQNPITNLPEEFDVDVFKAIKERLEEQGTTEFNYVNKVRRVYKQAFVGAEILEEKPCLCPTGFTYHALTAKRDRNDNIFYGLVRAMIDPQNWANKWLSQIMHIINSNSKGGILAEAGVFQSPDKARKEWAKPDSITIVEAGAISQGRIKEKQSINYPSGIDRLMELAIAAIPDVTGINLEMMGLADRKQAGVLEAQRKQSAMTILASLFDSMRKYRKQQGVVLLHIIQEYFAQDGRLIRLKDDAKKYIPLILDQNVMNYDVIVDDAPSSPNQKQAVWNTVIQMLPIMQSLDVPSSVWAEILKASPLPASISEKIGEIISQPPSPEAIEAQNINKEEKIADIQKTVSETELNKAKTNSEQVSAVVEQVNTLYNY